MPSPRSSAASHTAEAGTIAPEFDLFGSSVTRQSRVGSLGASVRCQ